jgi:hypothetical protein
MEQVVTAPLKVRPLDAILVCSHDCDLVHGNLDDEPTAELLVARSVPLDEENGVYLLGRNPRRLQFRSPAGSGGLFQVRPFERWSIQRVLLARLEPRPDWLLTEETKRILASWLARRFFRTALPDSFNDRIRPARNRIRDALKQGSEAISAIYVGIDPDSELEDGAEYRVEITATMRAEDYDLADLRMAAERTLGKIASAIGGCTCIDLTDSRVISEAEFTLDDLRHSQRLDTDEDISSRSPDHPQPVNP